MFRSAEQIRSVPARPQSIARSALWVLAAILCVQIGACVGSRDQKPNLILITIDTTRADHLGCYGYSIPTSPTLDELAANGVRFELAIAQSSVTPVSCASQLTGTYPYRHGLRAIHGTQKTRLLDHVPTLPEELQRLGYRTAAFVSAYPASSKYGLSRGFELFDEAFLASRGPARITKEGVVVTGASQRTAAETNARAIPWLRENAGEPFFLWLHYFDPHDATFRPPESVVAPFWSAWQGRGDKAAQLAVYDAEIFFTDLHIAAVVDELSELGIRDRTILVVTADHGEGLGDHDWWTHGILYQEQIRIPLIFNGPGIPEGVVLGEPVEHVDIFPTILDLAQPGRSELLDGLHGRSLVPSIQGKHSPPGDRSLYSEVHNARALRGGEREKQGVLYSLIEDGLKLIHYPRQPSLDELYDLRSDPRELNNIIASDREKAARLLESLEQRGAVDLFLPDASEMDPEDYQHLKSLGYLD
jgi:arylsulfatase A-like enzyme